MYSCAVVMPAYNEEGCIERTCREWLARIASAGGLLIVVDDGSRDRTPDILQTLAVEHAGLRVIRQVNGGHGKALLRGYSEALAVDCEWVMQVDSDGEISASDFDALWSERERSRFILGCRYNRQDPSYRLLLSGAHNLLLRAAFGVRIGDPNVPFRLMRADLLRDLLRFVPADTFAPNVFLSLLAARKGEPLLDIPVHHRERLAGASTLHASKMARICMLCLKQLVRFRLNEFRGRIPQTKTPEVRPRVRRHSATS